MSIPPIRPRTAGVTALVKAHHEVHWIDSRILTGAPPRRVAEGK